MRNWIFTLFMVYTATLPAMFLINDTSYLLIALVYGANGQLLSQTSINPGEQTNWTRDLSPTFLDTSDQQTVSITPYTVIWRCPHGGDFSACTNASPGSLVLASQCPGAQYCKPKDKKGADQETTPTPTQPGASAGTASTTPAK